MPPFKTLIFLISMFAALPASAQAPAAPQAPEIAARAYLLLDFFSGQTLASENADRRLEPASLTKLMTAYLTFSALKQKRITLDQEVPVSEKAWKAEGSRMFIEPRMPVSVDQLLRGMIVQSGNDACIALAEAVAGSEEVFAQMMNQEAKRLGMNNTHFMNSHGLPHPEHYTTARDVGTLAAAIIRDYPEHYALYSLKEYTYNNIRQSNRNRLLWTDPNVDGIKTGHTEGAGYSLVSSARRDHRRLVAVVMGTESEAARAIESQKLLNWGLQFWDTVRAYEKGKALAELQVWKGAAPQFKAGVDHDVYLSLPRGQADRIKAQMERKDPIIAPVSAGQRIGTMKLTVDGRAVAEVPVVALETVPVASLLGRAWDSLKLLFN